MEQVSELLTLKIENTALKLQQLQAQARELQAEQTAFVEQAREEVGAPKEHIFNTTTRLFQAPPGMPPAQRRAKV